MRVRNYLLAAALTAALPGAVAATDATAIRTAVTAFMTGYSDDFTARSPGVHRVEFTIGTLDTRLALPDCAVPLTVTAQQQPQLQPRLNTQVSCTSGNGWSLYVPVELAVYRPVVVAGRPLARGETLDAGDLHSIEMNVARLNGQYLTDPAAAVGMDVRRPIGQESPVLAEHLQPPLLVRRGEAVLVSAAGSAVSVRMPGVALTDGRRGEQIRVRNQSSARVVQARVVAPGQVEVVM
jgi:flagella basal body P-ring formation protein FlgA